MARVCFRTLARWSVEGKDLVPPGGPFILACNHLSNADPPFLAASLRRRLNFLGKSGLFSNPISSFLIRSVGVQPLDDRGLNLVALRWVLERLRQGDAVALFPEGTRSRTGAMGRANPGIAYLATKSQATILPVAITGTENIPGFWRIALPLCRVSVTVGTPFALPVIEGRIDRDLLEHLTDTIMHRIAVLLPPEYRGYYATPEPVSSG